MPPIRKSRLQRPPPPNNGVASDFTFRNGCRAGNLPAASLTNRCAPDVIILAVREDGPDHHVLLLLDLFLDLSMRLSASEKTIVKLFQAYQKRGMAKDNAVKLIAASLSMTSKDVWDVVHRVEGHV